MLISFLSRKKNDRIAFESTEELKTHIYRYFLRSNLKILITIHDAIFFLYRISMKCRILLYRFVIFLFQINLFLRKNYWFAFFPLFKNRL